MKKAFLKIFCVLFFILNKQFLYAQGACFGWARSIGSTGMDGGVSITADGSGNVYTTGSFQGTVDFDPGPGVYNLTSAGGDDVFVIKLNSSGSLVWAVKVGSPSNDDSFGICLDGLGNLIVTGSLLGGADFDPGPGVTSLSSSGSNDIFVWKLDVNGNLVWARLMGGSSSNDIGYSIAADAAGNVFTTGLFNAPADFNPGAGTFTLGSAGGYDIFVSKLDASGNFVWAKKMGSTSDDIGYGISTDGSGNVITSGQFYGTVDFDPGVSVVNVASNGSYDIFVSKLDNTGNFVWAKNLGGTNADYGQAVKADASGNVYSTGYYSSVGDFDPGPGSYTLSAGATNYDQFISKLDQNGNFTWARSIGTSGTSEGGYAIDVDASGNVYTTGFFSSVVDFDPGPSVYTLSTQGSQDVFASRYDASGNFVWAKRFGAANADNGKGIAVDASNNVYLTGNYALTVDFDPGPGTFTITSLGSTDAYIEKLSQLSAPSVTISGSTSFCSGGSVDLITDPAVSYTWSNGANTQSITATSSGNYFVSITVGSCVTTSTAIPVTAYPLPTIAVNSGSICSGNSFTVSPSGANTYTITGGSNIISPTITTSYSVTGTSTAGCTGSNTAVCNVTVNSIPVIGVNSGSICAGNSFTMMPSGALTYSFSGGSAIVSPTADASYSVTGTSSAGCVSASPAISNVTVLAYPLPTVSVNSGSICFGTSFTMVPSGALSYSYSGGSPIVSPSITTSYSVTGTNSLGCVSSSPAVSTVSVFQSPTVGVNAGSICQGQTFTIFPVGATSYTVSGGSFVVTPSITTNYSVIGTNTLGCQSINTAICSVTVNNNPTITVNSGLICPGTYFNLSPGGASTYTVSGGAYIVSPTVTTNYTVNGTSVAGCVSAIPAIATVSVSSYPPLSVQSGSICYGQSYSIVATGSPTYDVSGGSALVSPSVSTFYTVSTTNTAGCTTNSTCVVIVQPLPTVNVLPSSDPLCIGETATLNAGVNAITYTWSNGSNSPSLVVSPITSTSYTLTGTGVYGCVNTSVFLLTVDACAGIESHAPGKDSRISLYPNPNAGIFTVEATPPYDLNIFNGLGQLVFSGKGDAAEKNISIETLPSGIYIVRIKTQKAAYDTRLVKTD